MPDWKQRQEAAHHAKIAESQLKDALGWLSDIVLELQDDDVPDDKAPTTDHVLNIAVEVGNTLVSLHRALDEL